MFWTPVNEKWIYRFIILSENDQELYIAFLNDTERWSLILINKKQQHLGILIPKATINFDSQDVPDLGVIKLST